MSNWSKSRGTQWESRLLAYLRDSGYDKVRREVQHGANDQGDIHGLTFWDFETGRFQSIVIEAKNEKAFHLAEWIDQGVDEATNAKARVGVVMFPRRNHAVSRSYTLLQTCDLLTIIGRPNA